METKEQEKKENWIETKTKEKRKLAHGYFFFLSTPKIQDSRKQTLIICLWMSQSLHSSFYIDGFVFDCLNFNLIEIDV